MSRYRLVVDERERSVFDTLRIEMKEEKDASREIDYEIKTLTVGDYAIIENRTELLVAIFERKTLEKDFPASIRDGRYENKEKMIKARNKSNCRLYYIVEGPLDPSQDRLFSRMPYHKIESAMIHLEMRDGFHIMRTKDINDTIKHLIRLIHSLETVDPESINESVSFEAKLTPTHCTMHDDASLPVISPSTPGVLGGVEAERSDAPTKRDNASPLPRSDQQSDAMSIITEKHEKRDIDIVREIWSCLRGVSISSSDSYIKKFTLKELVRGEISTDTINSLKTPNGKDISKSVKKSLKEVSKDSVMCERMLSKVPGISIVTAKEILTGRELGTLLSYEIETISIIKVGKNKRSLGAKKAGNILKFFTFKIQ